MTIREILDSLDNYCCPTNTQVEHNDTKLMQAYNPNDPIVSLFEQFDECRAIARADGTPFSDAQLVQKFSTLMEKLGSMITSWRNGHNFHIMTKYGRKWKCTG